MKHVIRVGAGALAMMLAVPVSAQTAITADTAAGVTTRTTVTQDGSVIEIDGGRRVGNNLFHSFSGFSLGTGDTAVWVRSADDGASIANIINRITGGRPSIIDGQMTTEGMPNANFFFINPAGIVFGANAEIAVPNVAHFSTADNLRFADGGVYGVTTPGGSVFSVAAPAAFGFLGSQGNITITDVGRDFAGRDTGLSLSAANITIRGADFIPGRLDLIALGNAARTISLADPLAVRSGAGNVSVSESYISVQPSTLRDGLVRINAGSLMLVDTILASDSNELKAAGMRIVAGDVILRNNLTYKTQTYLGSYADGDGDAADLDLDALRVIASGQSSFGSISRDGAVGDAGAIRIRTGLLSLANEATITSSAYGQSNSGSISIVADVMSMTDRANIQTTTYGDGFGGDMTITVNSLFMDDATISAEAEYLADGMAGAIRLTAKSILLDNGSQITSSNDGSGDGGLLEITADTITLRNSSLIRADTFVGGGGIVFLKGGTIRIESESEVTSITDGEANAGIVSVEADNLVIDGGKLNSSTTGSGQAGTVLVVANNVDLRNGGEITTSTSAEGRAGQIAINARTITMSSGAAISSETSSSGPAGNIVIAGRDGVRPDLTITGGSRISSAQSGPDATGDAGTISITANNIYLGPSRTPAINTDVLNGGNAGAISLEARSITVDGAQVTSRNSLLPGVSGSIDITADTLRVINGGQIDTTSFNSDLAGAISITVGTLTVAGSSIRSEARFDGTAGDIEVEADRIELLDGGTIQTNSALGAAGNITLLLPSTGTLLLRGAADSGVISTSSGPGTGGIITISNPYLILSDGGQILALGQASGADVLIQSGFFIRSADRLNLLSVNGSLLLDSQVGDLSTGAEQVDLSFLDASSVLRGQCAGSRRGGTNQLNLRTFGPNAAAVVPTPQRDRPIVLQGRAGALACGR